MAVDLAIRDGAQRTRIYSAEVLNSGGEPWCGVKVGHLGIGFTLTGEQWEAVDKDFGSEVAVLVANSATNVLRVRTDVGGIITTMIYPAGSWPTFIVTGKDQ